MRVDVFSVVIGYGCLVGVPDEGEDEILGAARVLWPIVDFF